MSFLKNFFIESLYPTDIDPGIENFPSNMNENYLTPFEGRVSIADTSGILYFTFGVSNMTHQAEHSNFKITLLKIQMATTSLNGAMVWDLHEGLIRESSCRCSLHSAKRD